MIRYNDYTWHKDVAELLGISIDKLYNFIEIMECVISNNVEDYDNDYPFEYEVDEVLCFYYRYKLNRQGMNIRQGQIPGEYIKKWVG